MLEAKEKSAERIYQVVVAQTKGDGEDTVWEAQEITATSFSIDDSGNLRFWMARGLIAAISPGNWQRVTMKDESIRDSSVYIK